MDAARQRARLDAQRRVLPAYLDQPAVHRRGEVRATAPTLLEERVGGEGALENALAGWPAGGREEGGDGRHQRCAAAAKPELALAHQERARVDGDVGAEVGGDAAALGNRMQRGQHRARVAARHLVARDGRFPARALGKRGHDQGSRLLAEPDPHLGIAIDRGQHRRRAHQDHVLAAQEELPGRPGHGLGHRYPSLALT